MKKIIMLSLLLTSCANEEFIVNQPIQKDVSTITVYEQNTAVMDENEYREKNGQALLTSGLSCSLHVVANTTTTIPSSLPTAVGSFTLKKSFNQPNSSTNDGLNILPDALKSTYKTWYVVKCTGYIAIDKSDYYSFELTSDDGAKLYVGGSLLIDNDGLHGAQKKVASKSLKRGVHAFRLDYLQASGSQALILESGGQVIDSKLFYR